MICRGMPVLPVSTRICAGRQDRRFHLPGRSFDATSTSIPFDAEPTLASRRRPESWWVPVEAAGGSPLLQELISRRLFDPGLAARAMTALSGYFCWPDDALARASLRRHPLRPRCSRARDRCRCPRRAVGGHVGDDLSRTGFRRGSPLLPRHDRRPRLATSRPAAQVRALLLLVPAAQDGRRRGGPALTHERLALMPLSTSAPGWHFKAVIGELQPTTRLAGGPPVARRWQEASRSGGPRPVG